MATAPEWIVEYQKCTGNPVGYGPWKLAYEAIATEVTHNVGSTTTSAKIVMNGKPWNYTGPLELNDRVRARSTELRPRDSTLLFDGVLTAFTPHFTGSPTSGQEQSSFLAEDFRYLVDKMSVVYGQWGYRQDAYSQPSTEAWEILVEPILHNKWHVDLIESNTSPFNSLVRMTGRRCIFNEDGKPNKSPTTCNYFPKGSSGGSNIYGLPVFGLLNPEFWSARDMIVYLLTIENAAMTIGIGPVANVSNSVGLDSADFNVSINHFIAERLTPLEAVEAVTNFVGWQFRLDSYWDDDESRQRWVFYQPGTATERVRSEDNPIVLHTLYAGDNFGPASIDGFAPATETVTDVLSRGENLVSSGNLLLDSRNVANVSHALGGRKLFEATFELVPAWGDDTLSLYLSLDRGHVNADLDIGFLKYPRLGPLPSFCSFYLTDDDITLIGSDISSDYSYYNVFMPQGDWFNGVYASKSFVFEGCTENTENEDNSEGIRIIRDTGFYTSNMVGRKWALNETGIYSKTTGSQAFSRGGPYNFRDAIDGFERKDNGYFPRSIKNTLTSLGPDGNSIKYKIQWSINSGKSWLDFDYKVLLLEDEFGIYIAEPNLAMIKPLAEQEFFEPSDFDGLSDIEKNYFTEMCFQNINRRAWTSILFPWTLQMRVVCSVELDERLVNINDITNQSGSKYAQSVLLDLSSQHQFSKRENSSIFTEGDVFPSNELDSTDALIANQTLIDKLNREARRTGNFAIPYIYAAEGLITTTSDIVGSDTESSGEIEHTKHYDWRLPRFTVGDCIEGIAGRGVSLATLGGGQGADYNYVTVEQVRYLPEKGHTEIVTADLRRSFL